MIARAFRTAPWEALLHIARMLLMRHHVEKLTYTSALRLYRVPRESQLLRRLSPEWYAPRPSDLPLAVPSPRAQTNKAPQTPHSARSPSSEDPQRWAALRHHSSSALGGTQLGGPGRLQRRYKP